MSLGKQVDMRGFRHALEPLEKRQQWRQDALQARLGRARQALAKARGQLEDTQALQRREAASAMRAAGSRIDALTHRRTLEYLAQLQRRASGQREAVQQLQAQCEGLQAQCVEGQQELELLAAHRGSAEQAWATETLHRQSAQADSDWLARARWPGAVAVPDGGELIE